MFQLVPNLPPFFNMKWTEENGELTTSALLYNDQLWQALNLAVQILNQSTNQGMQTPWITTLQIQDARNDLNVPVGTMWFNTDQKKLQFKSLQYDPSGPTNGKIEQITSTLFY